jgi:hypothetical protein
MPADPDAEFDDDSGHQDWFRAPNRREHLIASLLFVGFGIFFILLFVVLWGWWFRWVILILAAISIMHGIQHAIDSRRAAD